MRNAYYSLTAAPSITLANKIARRYLHSITSAECFTTHLRQPPPPAHIYKVSLDQATYKIKS